MKSAIQHTYVFKALAHDKRLNIVNLLSDGELSVGEIQRELNLSQSNLSQHLKTLRDAKIVKARRNGKHVLYSLSYKKFYETNKLINEINSTHPSANY